MCWAISSGAKTRVPGDAAKYIRRRVRNLAEQGHHRGIDPDIDTTEGLGRLVRSTEYCRRIGDVRRQRQRGVCPLPLGIRPRGLKPIDAPCEQGRVPSALGEGARGGAADTGGGSSDHDSARPRHCALTPKKLLL
jgi:hypothetical protein